MFQAIFNVDLTIRALQAKNRRIQQKYGGNCDCNSLSESGKEIHKIVEAITMEEKKEVKLSIEEWIKFDDSKIENLKERGKEIKESKRVEIKKERKRKREDIEKNDFQLRVREIEKLKDELGENYYPALSFIKSDKNFDFFVCLAQEDKIGYLLNELSQ